MTADIDGCGAGVDGAEDAGELDDVGSDAVRGDVADANATGVHGGHGRVAVPVAVAVERTNQRPLRKVTADYKRKPSLTPDTRACDGRGQNGDAHRAKSNDCRCKIHKEAPVRGTREDPGGPGGAGGPG